MWNNVVVKKLNTDRNPDLCKFYSNLRWMLCPALHLNPLWCFLYQAYFWLVIQSLYHTTFSFTLCQTTLCVSSFLFLLYILWFILFFFIIYPHLYALSHLLILFPLLRILLNTSSRIFLITPKHLKNLFSTCTCYNCPRIFLIK